MDRSWESIYFISQLKRSHVYVEICSEQTADARHFEKNSQIYADEFDLRQVDFLKGPHSAFEQKRTSPSCVKGFVPIETSHILNGLKSFLFQGSIGQTANGSAEYPSR